MERRSDVAVAGGGPAGLATAIFAARAGLRVVVCERADGPPDKACGEGLMPAGVRVLEELGVRALLDPEDCSPIDGIRWVEGDGSSATGRLPGGGGLGVRRTALATALARRAGECGVELRWGCPVDGFETTPTGVTLQTGQGSLEASVLVAADGLHSRIRKSSGLGGPRARRPRFGLRQHFRVPPWSRFVEVHLGDGVEAFATPAGASRVGIAFLWEKERIEGTVSFEALLGRFPALGARLSGAPSDSRPMGAGPLEQAVRSVVADRLALVGDAAGYVDAITGEGVTLALVSARTLGAVLPGAVAAGASRAALDPYARVHAHEFRKYAAVCRAVLGLARTPALRRRTVAFLGAWPALLDRTLSLALS